MPLHHCSAIAEKYIWMGEPDHIFLRPPPLWATPERCVRGRCAAAALPPALLRPTPPPLPRPAITQPCTALPTLPLALALGTAQARRLPLLLHRAAQVQEHHRPLQPQGRAHRPVRHHRYGGAVGRGLLLGALWGAGLWGRCCVGAARGLLLLRVGCGQRRLLRQELSGGSSCSSKSTCRNTFRIAAVCVPPLLLLQATLRCRSTRTSSAHWLTNGSTCPSPSRATPRPTESLAGSRKCE